MDARHQAEEVLAEVATELFDALGAGASEALVGLLALNYDAAFDRWAQASGFDLNRSSFEQRLSLEQRLEEERDGERRDSA